MFKFIGRLVAPLKSALGLIVVLQFATIAALMFQTYHLSDELRPPSEYDIAQAIILPDMSQIERDAATAARESRDAARAAEDASDRLITGVRCF